MPTAITPQDLAEAVRLVQKDKCRDFATTAEVAAMLGVRKMDILSFIDLHPELVHAEERFREKKVKTRVGGWGALRGRTWTEERTVNGASLGLCIIGAYAAVEDNPWQNEWLAAARQRFAKTLWSVPVDNYGEILGTCCIEDKKPSSLPYDRQYRDHRRNTWLWRNTKEKLEAAKAAGGLVTESFCMGGFGDSYIREEPYSLTSESRRILEEKGWTIL